MSTVSVTFRLKRETADKIDALVQKIREKDMYMSRTRFIHDLIIEKINKEKKKEE